MVVHTQLTSQVAEKAQRGMMELLLVNHPLDCPMCDKGGECPLQNQAMSTGQGETRFDGPKRTFPKPIALSAQVLLDRERCIQCARCTRFADQIPGDPLIELVERGPQEQVAVAEGVPFNSYFSGNTVQICPVGALTGASYRFRARPFDLVSTPSICEHCAAGCRQRTDHRRGAVTRRLAGDAPEVNEEWNCDKGRWAFTYATQPDRLASPLVRDESGVLQPASWPEAIGVAARGLLAARGRTGVLPGGRLTAEDAYGYAKFARVALATNDIDMRARPHSAEELEFISDHVAGKVDVTYADLERAPAVLLAGFEPEDECPIVFLRLRKAVRNGKTTVYSLAALASLGLTKLSGVLLSTAPGAEAAALQALAALGGPGGAVPPEASTAGRTAAAGGGASSKAGAALRQPSQASTKGGVAAAKQALRQPNAVILVGERLAEVPGALPAAAALARQTGARLAWIPRRAGERGAIEAGALPSLLPGGRRVGDAAATSDLARAWGVSSLPGDPGYDTTEILAAAGRGDLEALIVGGVDPADLPDPAAAIEAIEAARFVVSLELRVSAVTDRADVIFPVAAVAEKPGTFVDWEGRAGSFPAALPVPTVRSDLHVLAALADEMDVHLGLPDIASARRELTLLTQSPALASGGSGGSPPWAGTAGESTPAKPASTQPGGSGGSPPWAGTAGESTPAKPASTQPVEPGPGRALLATWHNLLDAGRMQDGDPNLAGTARAAIARMSAATASEAGTADGGKVTVATGRGAITVPVEIAEMPDRVVWLPTNSVGSAVRQVLGAGHGSEVTVRSAE
jgi:NADH-quinone oxidoreductase subunit G